jgi:RimJ/RimL family protein N-acetyltransferase
VELVDYTDADLALSIELEADPQVMTELGGPRPVESIERVHPRRVMPTADGGMYLKVMPDGSDEAAGTIGVWWSEWNGEELWELGWMLRPRYHGRGMGSEALGMLIDRIRPEPRFDVVHAFPGVTNAPSNGLCRKFGFELLGSGEVEFAGRPLTVNHWALRTGA